jgi:SPP1 family predicted phage head-tail adaptor
MTSNVIGSLRHRVTIERPQPSPQDGGGATIEWTPVGEVFARIDTISGREVEVADGRAGRVTHKVLIRYRNDILPEMRIVTEMRRLDVRSVIDVDGRRRWLQCLCEEQLP